MAGPRAAPKGLRIAAMGADPGPIATVSRWRHDEWLRAHGYTYDATVAQLEDLIAETRPDQIALLAEIDGMPAGTCLLVPEELDQRHDRTPWLAGLYVAPDRRGQGIGSALVRAIEAHARAAGFGRIHLYTVGAEALYASLGWTVEDRFDWDGEPSVLMARDL